MNAASSRSLSLSFTFAKHSDLTREGIVYVRVSFGREMKCTYQTRHEMRKQTKMRKRWWEKKGKTKTGQRTHRHTQNIQTTKWFTISLLMWTDSPFNLNLWIIIIRCVCTAHRWITSEKSAAPLFYFPFEPNIQPVRMGFIRTTA